MHSPLWVLRPLLVRVTVTVTVALTVDSSQGLGDRTTVFYGRIRSQCVFGAQTGYGSMFGRIRSQRVLAAKLGYGIIYGRARSRDNPYGI